MENIQTNYSDSKLDSLAMMHKYMIIGLMVLMLFLIGYWLVYLGMFIKDQISTNKQPNNSLVQVKPVPTQAVNSDYLGKTTFALGKSGQEYFMKQDFTTTAGINPITSQGNTVTKYFSSDLLRSDISEVKTASVSGIPVWKTIATFTTAKVGENNPQSVDPTIFNFRVVPKSEDVLFTIEDNFNVKAFYFNNTNQTLSEILAVEKNYPKFDSLSPDNKYAVVEQFSCWGCDGDGSPETYILNLQTLAVKNLGRLTNFSWTGTDKYSYQKWVKPDCGANNYANESGMSGCTATPGGVINEKF